MIESDAFRRAALGAVAGLAGTVALALVLKSQEKIAPSAMPPMRDDPGRFMVNKTKQVLPSRVQEYVPDKAEALAANALRLGYGSIFGAIYGLSRRRGGSSLVEGPILGIAAWAAGYLGWLPATGLMRPVWKQKAHQAITPAAEHALYGMATVAAYDWMVGR